MACLLDLGSAQNRPSVRADAACPVKDATRLAAPGVFAGISDARINLSPAETTARGQLRPRRILESRLRGNDSASSCPDLFRASMQGASTCTSLRHART